MTDRLDRIELILEVTLLGYKTLQQFPESAYPGITP